MADVIVVECAFSRARLIEIERAIVRIRDARPESCVDRVRVNVADNVVDVALTGRKTVLTVAAFEPFGGAVKVGRAGRRALVATARSGHEDRSAGHRDGRQSLRGS